MLTRTQNGDTPSPVKAMVLDEQPVPPISAEDAALAEQVCSSAITAAIESVEADAATKTAQVSATSTPEVPAAAPPVDLRKWQTTADKPAKRNIWRYVFLLLIFTWAAVGAMVACGQEELITALTTLPQSLFMAPPPPPVEKAKMFGLF